MQTLNEIMQIFGKIKGEIRDQASGMQVICVVEIYSNYQEEGVRRLITSAEYLKLKQWLHEKGIDFSENKNSVDASKAKTLFMEVAEDHWLVFHCSKRVLMQHFAVQSPEPKAAPVVALHL